MVTRGTRIGGRDSEGVWNDVYTPLCLGHRELCSMFRGSLGGRGGAWGECIHACVWLSVFAGHLKLSQHCYLLFSNAK